MAAVTSVSLPPVSILNADLGALLVASWFDMMQLMLEMVQVIRYFASYPKDRLRTKILVASALFIDIVAVLGHDILIYLYTITNWGRPDFLSVQHWPVGVFLPANGLNAVAVQFFLLYRLWSLQHNLFIFLPLAMLSLASFSGIMATAIISMLHPSLADRSMAVVSSSIWLGCGAAADCAIAGSLVWHLSRMSTPFEETKSLINRLMAYAVSTGAAPALLALSSLITFLASQETNICVAIGFVMGRTYTITLLWNLNSRISQEDNSRHTLSARQKSIAHEVIDMKPAVSVVRTVHVDRDSDKDSAGNSDFLGSSYGHSTANAKASYPPFADV